MKYEFSPEIQEKACEIVKKLELKHVDTSNIACIKSFGSKSNAIARCHALGKVMQKALNRKAFYTLEFISEKFDLLNEEDKIKTIIHELIHIPKSFGGGFKYHDYVCQKTVNKLYKTYMEEMEKNHRLFSDDS